MAKSPVTAVRLFGITALDANEATRPLAPNTDVVGFRDIGAVIADTPHARPALAPDEVAAYRSAVESVFATQAIVPAPAGVVFRGRDAVARWLELHYVTLNDALAYVEGRAVGRVHVSRVGGNVTVSDGRTEEMAVDIDAIASESFRVLRRHAVALMPMRPQSGDSASSGASFLIDRERWRFFEDVVAEEGRRDPDLRFQLTGPWPPYDFVRMQFGG
jgi:hypothetical protein